jgi:hypothetical protein
LAWLTHDERKHFRKKIWSRLSSKWASFSKARLYTEFWNDEWYATAEKLDDVIKVYRYNGSEAGIRYDTIVWKDIVMNADAYIYHGNFTFNRWYW